MSVIIPQNTSAVETLAEVKAWICWKLIKGENGRIEKVPYDLTGKYKISIKKPENLSTYDDVCQALLNGDFKSGGGAGFVFTEESEFCGIDLDKIRDPNTGILSKAAKEQVDFFNSYTEVSPSQTGLHIIIKAKKPQGSKCRSGFMEIYDNLRFFTITGMHHEGTPQTVEDRQQQLNEFASKYLQPTKEESKRITVEGEFKYDESLQPPEDKFEAAYANDNIFQRTWDRKRDRELEDKSASGYDYQLVSFAIRAGWTPLECFALICSWRRKHGELTPKFLPREDYLFKRVYANAMAWHEKNKTPKNETFEVAQGEIRNATGILIDKIVKMGRAPGTYFLVINGQRIHIGGSSELLNQTLFQQIIYDYAHQSANQLKRSEWHAITGKFHTITEYEPNSDLDHDSGIKELIVGYWEKNGIEPGDDSDWKKQANNQKPFSREDWLYLNMDDYRRYLLNQCDIKQERDETKKQLLKVKFEGFRVCIRSGKKVATKRYWRIRQEHFFNEEFIPSVGTPRDWQDEIFDEASGQGSSGIRNEGSPDLQPDKSGGA